MARYAPLSRSKHTGKTWSPPAHFGFAAQAPYVEVVGAEATQVAALMPLAFVRAGERFALVGLTSCLVGHNLFVAPNGGWTGSYVPATLRFHPFRLMRVSTPDKAVLCVDETSDLIKDGGGHPLFDDNGQPSKLISEVVEVLNGLEKSRASIDVATRALEQAGVIVPWQLEVKGNKAGTIFERLHRVDEPSLQKLDDTSFLKLRQSGALALAYLQIISMGRVAFLEQLAASHQRFAATTSGAIKLSDVLGGENTELLNFDLDRTIPRA